MVLFLNKRGKSVIDKSLDIERKIFLLSPLLVLRLVCSTLSVLKKPKNQKSKNSVRTKFIPKAIDGNSGDDLPQREPF